MINPAPILLSMNIESTLFPQSNFEQASARGSKMNIQDAVKIYTEGPGSVIARLCEMDAVIEQLKSENAALKIQIATLKKDSSTSSKKPSSDDITKKSKDKKDKDGKKRKKGAQPGHPRNTRPPFEPDQIDFDHIQRFSGCPVCGGHVNDLDLPPRIQQQVELIEVPIEIHEHRSYPVWCPHCQEIHYKPFPENVIKEGLFKPQITALVAYLSKVCHASFSTIRKFFRDILGLQVSRGYLAKIITKVSLSLKDPYDELLNRIPLESRLNIDETGHKQNGDRFWTWVFKAELYVLFKIDKSRGSKVLIDVLGEQFQGVIGCDNFGAYRKFMRKFNVTVQFCIAHLIRDIRFMLTLDKEQADYGQRLLDAVKAMFKIIHEHPDKDSQDFIDSLEKAKQDILDVALNDVPSQLDKDGKETKRAAQNMARRFRNHGQQYFEFITTPGMDPTNNVAEQAIRFVVIDRHITQGTRSEQGNRNSERLWTVIATCALQGRSAYEFILCAVQAFYNNDPAPSLLPGYS